MLHKKDFMLLLERMDKRHSREDSLEVMGRQLLTEGFGKGFYNRLKGLNFRGPQTKRVFNLMKGADGVNAKNLDDILRRADAEGNVGFKRLETELNAAEFKMTNIESDGLNRYFNALHAIDDGRMGKGNSVTNIINELDDTNLTLKEKQNYVAEMFNDNPDLVNMGMADGKKIRDASEMELLKIVEDNFLSLNQNALDQIMKSQSYNTKMYDTPKKILKGADLQPGEILCYHPDNPGAYFVLSAENASSNFQQALKNGGFELFPVESASPKFKKTLGKSKKGKGGEKRYDVNVYTWQAYWKIIKKVLSVIGIEFGVKLLVWLGNCYFNLHGKKYNYWDGETESNIVRTRNAWDDCFRGIVDSSRHGDEPVDRFWLKNLFQFWVPTGALWGPISSFSGWFSASIANWGKTYEELNNKVIGKVRDGVRAAMSELTIREVLNESCSMEGPTMKSIYANMISDMSKEQKALNLILKKITGAEINEDDIAEQIAHAFDVGLKLEGDVQGELDKYTIKIEGRNGGLKKKYQMKDFSVKEEMKYFCNDTKARIIGEKLQEIKVLQSDSDKYCDLIPKILDMYTTDGFQDGMKISKEEGQFTLANCNATKAEIGELTKVVQNSVPDFEMGMEDLCEGDKLEKLKREYTSCGTYVPPELEEILKDSSNIDIKFISIPDPVVNYSWENKDWTCYNIHGAWQDRVATILEVEGKGYFNDIVESVKDHNGKIKFKLNDSTIKLFEGGEYSTFCSNDAIEDVTAPGIKKTRKECVADLTTHLKGLKLDCWNSFYPAD